MNDEITNKIKTAGVVGAGGAGFPTHAKVSCMARTVIVNGAECEPLLRVDQQLLELETVQVVTGLEAVMQAVGASQGIVALKGKHKGAVTALKSAISGKPITIHILGDFYPAGDEHVLVYETTGELVPQGGIPLKNGAVVINVETLANVADALAGKAVTHTCLTVAGEVAAPITIKLPVGTEISDVLALAGVTDTTGLAVIDGGPMMGKLVTDLSQPITKTTKGLIVLPAEHSIITRRSLPVSTMARRAKTACVQCRQCTDLCPRFLLGHSIEPHKIMRAFKHSGSHEQVVRMALTCSECGACEYACIMGLSPRTANVMLKQELSRIGITPNAPPLIQRPSNMRSERRLPVNRLIARLGLTKYNKSAPLTNECYGISKVRIKLKQHIGAPSRSLVTSGQWVEQGELIAEIPDNSLGANIHASISGFVAAVTDAVTIVSPPKCIN